MTIFAPSAVSRVMPPMPGVSSSRTLWPPSVLIITFFEGGGGCWDYRTCAAGSTFFDDDVDASDDPSYGAGVLDLDNPRNPFRGWSVLFIPSCTGDVYAGDAARTYRSGDADVTIYHRGHVNATAALDWVFQ